MAAGVLREWRGGWGAQAAGVMTGGISGLEPAMPREAREPQN